MKTFLSKLINKLAHEFAYLADIINYPNNRFNASIIKYKNDLYILSRKRNVFLTISKLKESKLGEYFAYDEKTIKLEYNKDNFNIDGRLLLFNNKLFCAYAEIKRCCHLSRQRLAEIDVDGNVIKNEVFDLSRRLIEKNWSFFDYNNEILFVYEIGPEHVVMDKNMNIVGKTNGIKWEYGEARGGTSPILIGDRYVAVFHSSLETDIYVEALKNKKKIYYAGWYTFEAKPPFKIIDFSKSPIIIPESNPGWHDVVFPCGLIKNDKGFLLSYGYQDRETRIVQLDNNMNPSNNASVVI